MKTDVIVIGAGMAGLATAALLAKQGKRVVVLEKGNVPGGRAYTYEEKGFTLNYGAHAVYRPESGILGELMARLGRPVPKCGYPDAMRSYWADGDRFSPIGAKTHQALMTALFPLTSKPALAKMFLAIKSAKPERIGEDLTWGAWVDAQTGDARLRRFARALGTVNTYTRPSAALSARFVLGHLQRNMFAKDYVGYMFGGWRSMYDVFIDELRAHGGEMLLGTHVDDIEIIDGHVSAVIASGTRYEADAFVCTLAPQEAPAIAAEGSPLAKELQKWSSLVDVRALSMDLGFSKRLRTDLSFVYDIERDLYYSLHSESATDLAPEGGQLMHAMAYLSPEEGTNDALLARRKEELVAGLDRFFAGWRDAVVVERTLPSVRVIGARSTPEQFERNRVPLRSATASNLYFAGDARDLPYNLTEVALMSAMEVADVLAGATTATSPVHAVRS